MHDEEACSAEIAGLWAKIHTLEYEKSCQREATIAYVRELDRLRDRVAEMEARS